MHNTQKWAPTIMRVIMGVTFLFAAYSKLKDPAGFTGLVKSMGVLPESLAGAYGLLLPYVELALGVLLILGLFMRVVPWVAALLLASFIVGVGIAARKMGVPFLMDPNAAIPSKDFAYLAMMVSIGLLGPGALALDSRIWKK